MGETFSLEHGWAEADGVPLCHGECTGDGPMTCYHRWTVYGDRPEERQVVRKGKKW